MNRTKDYRRAQEKKEKEHVKHIVKDVWHDEKLANDSTFIGKMAHSPQLCSCDMCGNPRHAPYGSEEEKLTLQERKANEDLKEMKYEKKQIKYPFSEDQTFCIGLTSNNEYFYISNVKPIDKYIVNWVGEDEWELKFEVPQFSIGYITIVARLIDNKPDRVSFGSYFVSTQNNEQDIKTRVINYDLYRIKSNLEDLEKEKKEYLAAYSKLSKYLLI